MDKQPEGASRTEWLLAKLDKALTRRQTLRLRFGLFQDVANTNGDDNAVAWLQATAVEGTSLNEEIGELTRRLLEFVE